MRYNKKKKKRKRKKKRYTKYSTQHQRALLFELRATVLRRLFFFLLSVVACFSYLAQRKLLCSATSLTPPPCSPSPEAKGFFFCTGESCIFFILHCCAHFSLLLFISFIFVFVLLLLLLRDTCQTTPRYCVSAIVPAVRSPLSPTAEVLGAETAKNLSAFLFFLPVCVHRPRVRSPGYTLFI